MQTQEKRNRRRIKTALGVTGAGYQATGDGTTLTGTGPMLPALVERHESPSKL